MLVLAPQAVLAGTSSGLSTSPPARDVVMDATLECGITLTIAAEDQSNLTLGETALDSAGFMDDTGADQDTVDFGSVNLLGGSMTLTNGGNAWLNGGDSSVNVIGALAVTISHTCTVAPTATIEATSPGVGGVTVRYDTSHHGNGWESSNFNLLGTAAALTFSSGTPIPLDLGFNVPQDTPSSSLTSTMTITTVGGS
jgi:hypothetical protein